VTIFSSHNLQEVGLAFQCKCDAETRFRKAEKH